MLQTKYQRPRPCTFQTRRDFCFFFLYKSMLNVSAPGRDCFWPKGYNLNNLGKGPLGETMYEISKAWAFWFQIRFLKVLYKHVKHVGPRAGPFLALGQ